MKPFNFAETKTVERNYYRRYVNVRLRRIAVLAVVTVVVSSFSLAVKTVYAGRVNRSKVELARVESLCNGAERQIARAKREAAEYEWRSGLAKSSRRVLDIVDTILGCVPDDVWLSKIQGLDNGPEVVLEGDAASFAALSQMISHLRATPSLTAVQLNSTRTVGPNGTEPVEFSLQLQIKNMGRPATEEHTAQRPAGVPDIGRTY
jgi:hypothetical protein